MWREAVILLMFAAGATLLYAGLGKSLPALAGFLRVPRRPATRDAAVRSRGDFVRAVLIGLGLLLLGALAIYGAVARLNQP